MTVRIFLAILLATLKISFGRENASDLGEATWEVHDRSFAREKSNLKRRFPAEKRYKQLRECFKQGLHLNPIKLLKLNDIFPLKSQQRLLHKEFLRNATRNVELFNQSLKLEPLYHKALQGKDINIAIIGGSNAAGANLEQDEKNIKGIFYNLFATWWNGTMGKWTGSHAIIHNLLLETLCSALLLGELGISFKVIARVNMPCLQLVKLIGEIRFKCPEGACSCALVENTHSFPEILLSSFNSS
ncbi:unnamed protein product [Porites lobata]|uniref:Uncharacterized protein n=1 Tax=Porites lobata TaxID=104759 RepID=A0ABN8NJ46_9CNID|nr:unnamed protein product [Porites lobata]